MANLGELTVRNVFKLARDVSTEAVVGQGEKVDPSLFLSSSGAPAVVDSMTVTISSVQLSRYQTLAYHILETTGKFC